MYSIYVQIPFFFLLKFFFFVETFYLAKLHLANFIWHSLAVTILSQVPNWFHFFWLNSFGETFYLAKLHLVNIIWRNFIWQNFIWRGLAAPILSQVLHWTTHKQTRKLVFLPNLCFFGPNFFFCDQTFWQFFFGQTSFWPNFIWQIILA